MRGPGEHTSWATGNQDGPWYRENTEVQEGSPRLDPRARAPTQSRREPETYTGWTSSNPRASSKGKYVWEIMEGNQQGCVEDENLSHVSPLREILPYTMCIC